MNASPSVASIIGDTHRTSVIASLDWQRFAAAALRGSAIAWYCVVVAGQLIFAVYIVGFFWRAALTGRPEAWNKVLSVGYRSGDTMGNLVLASHLLFAAVVTIGGLLKLLPQLRQRYPRIHRWNGRIFMLSAVVAGAGGLVMIWMRKAGGDLPMDVAISINALLIFLFAGLALRFALLRRFDLHRRWALRLFLVVGGGWFFRVGLMFWLMLMRRPVGFDPNTFHGPFLIALSFGQYLLPLAVLELYFRAQASRNAHGRIAMATGLGGLTLAMAAGIVGAAMMMWLPHL
jgi:hypothetical protein